jgi:prepilin-type processing-associated H-X9-DG protein
MYNNDYDGEFDAGAGNCWFYPVDGGWSWDTQPYIKSLTLLRDPTDNLSTQNWATWMFPPNNPTVSISYASNGYLWQDRNNNFATSMYGVMGFGQGPEAGNTHCGTGWMQKSYTSENVISQSAATIMLSARASGNNIFGAGDLISGVTWWDSGNHCPAGLIPNGTAAATPYTASNAAGAKYTINPNTQWGAVYTPYANQSVFAFCDGHAKAMNPAQTNPNPTKTDINAPDLSLFPSGHDSRICGTPIDENPHPGACGSMGGRVLVRVHGRIGCFCYEKRGAELP